MTIPAAPVGQYVDYSLPIDPAVWTKGPGDWKLYLYNYEASLTNSPGGAMEGPLYAVSQRVEDSDRNTGISYSTLLYQGGLDARNAAHRFRTAPTRPSPSGCAR